jgi:hypothetical protein
MNNLSNTGNFGPVLFLSGSGLFLREIEPLNFDLGMLIPTQGGEALLFVRRREAQSRYLFRRWIELAYKVLLVLITVVAHTMRSR